MNNNIIVFTLVVYMLLLKYWHLLMKAFVESLK